MPRSADPSNSPHEWLRFARGDLELAEANAPGGLFELLCFHAQQAAEKSIKGVLLHLGIEFAKTHDLRLLASLLPPDLRTSVVLQSGDLSHYAAVTRYPGLDEPVDEQEYLEALGIARAVVAWAESQIDESGANSEDPPS